MTATPMPAAKRMATASMTPPLHTGPKPKNGVPIRPKWTPGLKKARNAKEAALRAAAEKTKRTVKRTTDAQGNIVEEITETTTVTKPVPQPEEPEPLPETVGVNETLPELTPTTGRVSEEARAASRQKYVEGLDAFNQDDYERAREAWVQAVQLDPGNTDAAIGLQKVEELTGIR